MIRLPKELDFYSITYADGPDATCRGIHDMQLACMHDASLADRYHSNLFQALR